MHKLIMGDGIYIHENGNNSDNRKTNIKSARGYHNNGKVKYNGYIAIYNPNHHRAFENGCVYEHVLVAEEMLGRLLLDDDVVHHVDLNRTNNKKENLMIFASNEDHALYHAGAEAHIQDNGAYKCDRNYKIFYKYNNELKDEGNKNSIKIKKKIIHRVLCPVCNENYKSIEAKTCEKCYRLSLAMNIPPKEEIEQLIWNTPFTKIAEMYEVSDNAVRRWCKKYGLPSRRRDINSILLSKTK